MASKRSKTRQYQRAWFEANPGKAAEYRNRWMDKHRDDPAVRARLREQVRRCEEKLRREVIEAYGGKCACCGTDYFTHLDLDHIDGGGSAERRAEKSNRKLYVRLRKEGYPAGYQVLCRNCNWAKHIEGVCGCQRAHLTLVEVVGG